MTVSEYSRMKEKIIFALNSHEKNDEILCSLKESFRESINSERRFEQITTIGELMKILEIRDVLSEDNVGPLRKMARKLPDSEYLLKMIVEYEDTHVPTEQGNCYASKLDMPSKKENHAEGFLTTNPLTNTMSKRKKQRIFETISQEIGIFWRDLGRNLKIRECEIDEIDLQNIKLNAKATQLLECYEYKADPQRWFFVLCEALEKSRRRDLVRSIQEIMAMNI